MDWLSKDYNGVTSQQTGLLVTESLSDNEDSDDDVRTRVTDIITRLHGTVGAVDETRLWQPSAENVHRQSCIGVFKSREGWNERGAVEREREG
jgi:hypothetical protein